MQAATPPKVARPDRYAFNWLTAATVWVILPLLPRLPVWISLLLACLIVWRYVHEHHGWSLPGRPVHWAMALLIIIAVYKQYGTLLGRDAGLGLLTVLLGLKFLELRNLRDYMLSLFLLYILLLGGLLYSQTLWTAAYMLTAVALTLAVMYRLTVPAAIAPYARLRLAGGLLLWALPLTLVVYFLFPRIQGGLWGLPRDAYAGVTGMSDTMQLGSILLLTESQDTAFRVEFKDQPPARSQLYWRVMVLWYTDGETWTRLPAGAQPALTRGRGLNPEFEPLGLPVDYEVVLEPNNNRWMAALDLPAMVPPRARPLPGYLLEHQESIRQRQRYQLRSYPRYRTGELSALEREYALQLPPNVSARVRELAQRWRRVYQDPNIVREALAYFREQPFVYTLQPPPLGDDPVDDFLFNTRRGFCEHFAAAFVTLMRAAGIPSRVVVGYQGGEHNPAGDYFIVRQNDAHAWAEAWLPKQGWVRIDPTAAVAPERVEYGLEAVRRLERNGLVAGQVPKDAMLNAIQLDWLGAQGRRARLLLDSFNTSWNRWVSDYGQERQLRLLSWLGFEAPSWLQLIVSLALAATLIMLAVAAALLYPRASLDAVQAAYAEFCRKLARTGLTRAAHEGALSFAARCSQARPDLAIEIDAIAQQYIRLRYGGVNDSSAVQELRQRVRRFRPTSPRSLSDTELRKDPAQQVV